MFTFADKVTELAYSFQFFMSLITLLTDRKINDFFLGRVRGNIIKLCHKAQVIDLAHDIGAFNVPYAAFIIKHSYDNFPKGTVHIIGVDSEKGNRQRHLLLSAYGQYFIAADNGLFSLAFREHEIDAVYDVGNFCKSDKKQPAMLDFVEIAAHIFKKKDINELGELVTNYKRKLTFQPTYENDFILGKVVYIDSFRNIVTNISKELFENIHNKRDFTIYVGSTRNQIYKISESYQESQEGDMLAVFNSLGLLEIAINKGQVADLFNLTVNTNIRIEFRYNDEDEDDTYSQNALQGRLL